MQQLPEESGSDQDAEILETVSKSDHADKFLGRIIGPFVIPVESNIIEPCPE
jgi:hypothetical protein